MKSRRKMKRVGVSVCVGFVSQVSVRLSLYRDRRRSRRWYFSSERTADLVASPSSIATIPPAQRANALPRPKILRDKRLTGPDPNAVTWDASVTARNLPFVVPTD